VRRKTYEEVYEMFKERGYELISDRYTNNKQRLEYRCPFHPEDIQTTRLNDLTNGHGCRLCGRERSIKSMRKQADIQRLRYDDVKKEIEQEGFTLISDDYENARQKLEIKCPEGHISRMRLNDFRSGTKRCRKCVVNSRRTPYEKVERIFKEKGYVLLENEYVNNRTPLDYICPDHPDTVRKITLDRLKRGRGCYECGIESISGVNSVHYNHGISEEDRKLDRRLDPKEREWRIAVFRRDQFTCRKCGKYSRNNLNAHHKDAHHWCVERRYDVTNGETLCEECHKDFHSVYGYKYNTEAQFDEWMTEGEAMI